MGVLSLVAVSLLSQAPPLVTGVELRLPPDTEASLVQLAPDLVAVRKGQELSLRVVQRTIQRLMGTGRFADVVVYVEETPGGVQVIIEASPRRKVSDVYVEKTTGVLSVSDVTAAAKLERGSEYSPESMAEALENVRLAYRRKGYLHADVVPQATVGTGGIDVLLTVDEGQPTRLQSVSFAGETGLPLSRLLTTLDLEVGAIIDQDLVEKGAERLRKVLKAERYYRARVEAPVLDEGGHVSIPLRAGPHYTTQYRGNRRFPDATLEAVNAYDGSEALDRNLVDRMAAKLTAYYRYRGFHDARVTGRESVSPDGRDALLVMDIEEGEVMRVGALVLDGNSAVSDDELKGLLVELLQATAPEAARLNAVYLDALQVHGRVKDPAVFDEPSPPLESVLVDAVYREAAAAMRSLYRDRGFLEAKVELLPIELHERVATVKFKIAEGPRVYFEQVQYVGGPQGFPPADRTKSLVGEPYSARTVERTSQQLATDLARRGWLYAKIESHTTVERETQAQVVFKIELGPQVRAGKVLVRGLKRTDEGVARRQLVVEEGKLLSPDDLLDSQRNLISLGIFRTAEVRLLTPETAEPVKDVLVELVEAPRLRGSLAFGYYLAEGPRIGVDAEVPNLGGVAVSLVGNAQVYLFFLSAPATTGRVNVSNVPLPAQVGGRVNVALQNRGLLTAGLGEAAARAFGENALARALRSADVGTRIDVVGERVFRQSYQFNRFAALPGIDWSHRYDVGAKWARLKLTLLLQYEFDLSDVKPVTSFEGAQAPLLRSDQERLRFLFGTFALQTVRFSPTLDLRDDPVLPHRGVIVSTPVETTGALYAQNQNGEKATVKFVKLSGQVSAYFPFGPQIVLAISARMGSILRLLPESATPPVKRFYIGGASSLRGFPEDGMLPEDERARYRDQVRDCEALANPSGCSAVSQNVRDGKYVPSPGGELFGIGKAELRLPFVGDFNVGLFFEAGNLWLDPSKGAFTLRPVAGGGLRYLSPIGPLALDVGFNLFPDWIVNEALFNIHFNVGVF